MKHERKDEPSREYADMKKPADDTEEETKTDIDHAGERDSTTTADYSTTESPSLLQSLLLRFNSLFDRIIPPFAPRLPINERLVPGERTVDDARILHYAAVQIIAGLAFIGIGIILFLADLIGVGLGLSFLGFLLVSTGFEIEEIHVTSQRILIRHIGIVERILRMPSDEEHVLEHVVSFSVGRAPLNKAVVSIGVLLLSLLFLPDVATLAQWAVAVVSAAIIYIGLRLGRRTVAVYLAGGHRFVIGLRKGVPLHLIESFMETLYAKEEAALQAEN